MGGRGGRQRTSSSIALLLDVMDEAFDRRAWHGTTLRGSLRGMTVSAAIWRPAPTRINGARKQRPKSERFGLRSAQANRDKWSGPHRAVELDPATVCSPIVTICCERSRCPFYGLESRTFGTVCSR